LKSDIHFAFSSVLACVAAAERGAPWLHLRFAKGHRLFGLA
jgi:hypothetical protein